MATRITVAERIKQVVEETIMLGKSLGRLKWSALTLDARDGIHSDLTIARNALRAARAKLEQQNEA